jgi:hypothetical protein
MSRYVEIRSVGSELLHADGWTGMTKLIVAFRNFANVSEKQTSSPCREPSSKSTCTQSPYRLLYPGSSDIHVLMEEGM